MKKVNQIITILISTILFCTSQKLQAQENLPDINGTIKYINDLINREAIGYPLTKIIGIEKGYLIFETFDITSKEQWDTEKEKSRYQLVSIKSVDQPNLIIYSYRTAVLLNGFYNFYNNTYSYKLSGGYWYSETKITSIVLKRAFEDYVEYEYQISTDGKSASEIASEQNEIASNVRKQEQYGSRKLMIFNYNYTSKKFIKSKIQSSFYFEFYSNEYDYNKFKKALIHLLDEIMKKPELFQNHYDENDPFAPR